MLPAETICAFDIPTFKAGRLTLRPLTLGDVVMLEKAGISVSDDLSVANALLVANWLIARSFKLPLKYRFLSTSKQRLKAVARTLKVAFQGVVAGEKNSDKKVYLQAGYGWPLELAELIMAEYHTWFEDAASMPLARVFPLLACARVRKGGKAGGPDYFERMTLEEFKHG